jgi:hypothetical protein
VDPELGATGALDVASRHTWHFARTCKDLPPPVIRAVRAKLESLSTPTAIFLRESVGADATDEELAPAWRAALVALLDLDTTYAWGSKQRRAKLAGVASNPKLVAAIQAVAVGCERPPADMLAVLTIDASEASADALMPHFARAARDRDGTLDLLERLERHARDTPAMKAMFERVRALLADRNASSPALDLARRIGIGEVDTFWFSGYLGSTQPNEHRVPHVQSNLTIDSRGGDTFSVSVSRSGGGVSWVGTKFNQDKIHRDDLGLGRCEPDDLPAWLARAATSLDITWGFDEMGIRTNLRGKKRDRLLGWLRGEPDQP